MRTITVNASKSYDICIERGSLKNCGELISKAVRSKRFALITDSNVDKLYSQTVIKSMQDAGLSVCKYVFEAGEHSKSTENLNSIYNFLCENSITRTDCLIALGGGVTGDITGFAAATYLRGIPYIQIPTTLLAQIDSSVGGKTAINLTCGKNLVGAFKQPEIVICDSNTLESLTPEIVADGMAEAIKYGMIRDKKLFNLIAKHSVSDVHKVIDDIVYSCVSIKRDVVENDEFDTGERMILNFGHTIGHAIESFYHYETYTHGSAVAAGMCKITECAFKNGDCTKETLTALIECVNKYNLPDSVPADIHSLVKLCSNDKKRESNMTNFIICTEIGKCEIRKVSSEQFAEYMEV